MIDRLASLFDAIPTIAIPAVLALCFFLSAEIGFAMHRRFGGGSSSGAGGGAEDEAQVLQTALLVLALLLGFTFSMALSRYDERRQLVVQEANAIGTAWLQAGLVTNTAGPALQNELRAYAVVRQKSPLPSDHAILDRAAALRRQIWALTTASVAALDGPGAANLVNAITNVFDIGTQREKAVAARVPGEVMLLLVLFSCVACFLLGYVLNAHGHRHRFASAVLFLLLGLTIMLILDLDRPVDGAIRIDQSAMVSLVKSLVPAPVPAP